MSTQNNIKIGNKVSVKPEFVYTYSAYVSHKDLSLLKKNNKNTVIDIGLGDQSRPIIKIKHDSTGNDYEIYLDQVYLIEITEDEHKEIEKALKKIKEYDIR